MKPIAQALPSVQPQPTAAPTNAIASPASASAPPEAHLRRLWERMTALYGHAWTSAHGITATDPKTDRLTIDGETWQRALVGVTGHQLAAGLEACIAEGEEFPPNAPRFRAMCLGVPSFAAVKRETLRPDAERSPFTRAVWIRVDGYAHRQATTKDADRMLRDAYDLVRDEVMRGVPLAEPAALIAHDANPKPIGIPETREARAQRLAHLAAVIPGFSELRELYNPPSTDEE